MASFLGKWEYLFLALFELCVSGLPCCLWVSGTSRLLLFVKQITFEATNHPIFFFLFHPHPPPPSRHDKQPMVITRSLPVSEGDYFLPAENQMTNDHAERPQQQCVSRKADERGVERRGYGGGGGLSSPVQGDLFQWGCVIHNPHPLGWEVGRRCHGEAISRQLGGPRAARSGTDGCVRERLTVVEGARWVRCYF